MGEDSSRFFYVTLCNPQWNDPDPRFAGPIPTHYQIVYSVNKILNRWENAAMPARVKQNSKMDFNNTQFAMVRLSEADRTEFHSWWNAKGFDGGLEISTFIANGWKTSLTWDDANKCFICASTCKDERSVNANVCVTSRSDDYTEALLLNVYKVNVMYKNAPLPTERGKDNWG